MAQIPLSKLETVGNDFILVERDSALGADWSQVAKELCMRRYSVGSDGLLVAWRESGEVHLRFFNPDGTEDFCGNGLRCAAWYAYRRGWTSEEFSIHQSGKSIPMTVDPAGRVEAVMPPAEFSPAAIPTTSAEEMWEVPVLGVVGTAVTTGSAHFIVLCQELPGDEEFLRLGPAIENAPVFPERTSVMWVRPDAERHLTMRIWERGVGETMGCGTGATASACVWFRKHGLSGRVDIESRGGVLAIEMDRWDSEIRVECDPEELFTGMASISADALGPVAHMSDR